MLSAVEQKRLHVSRNTEAKRKSQFGQFLTPEITATFMSSLFPYSKGGCRLLDAGIALYNPDKSDRPVNSPKAVYQIEPTVLTLLRTFGTPAWHDALSAYLAERETLVARYTKEREQNRIPVEITPGKKITLSPGKHSELIRAIMGRYLGAIAWETEVWVADVHHT